METEEGQSIQDVVKESPISLSRQGKTAKLYMVTYYLYIKNVTFTLRGNFVYHFGS